MKSAFHLAYNVRDLDDARAFYGDLLGCAEGRSTDTWVDFNFFSHQISLHIGEPFSVAITGLVGGHQSTHAPLGRGVAAEQLEGPCEQTASRERRVFDHSVRAF